MSANCYRPSKDESEGQNERLTNKHIQTLALLQNLAKENQTLKTHVEQLEKECGECAELHAIAKETKAKIQKIQEECNHRVDRSVAGITAKHKQEMLKIIQEKLEAENDWLLERQQLQKLIDEQRLENSKLVEQLEQLKKHDVKIDVVNSRLDQTIQEILELKKDNEHLRAENALFGSQVTGYRADAEKCQEYERMNQELVLESKENQQKIKELLFKVSDLQTELDGVEEGKSVRNTAQDKLRLRVSNLAQDLKTKDKELWEYAELIHGLRGQLQERTEQVEFELEENDKLVMIVQRLEDELRARDAELLKRHSVPVVKREESPSFRDFVHMKREINELREENDVLKQPGRKPLALPTIKAPSITGSGDGREHKPSNVNHQTLSGAPAQWSSKWNKK